MPRSIAPRIDHEELNIALLWHVKSVAKAHIRVPACHFVRFWIPTTRHISRRRSCFQLIMWSAGSLCLFLAFLVSFRLAHSQKSTIEVCSTKYGATSVSPVPSSTSKTSTTLTVTVHSTISPTITVTPKPTTTDSTLTHIVTKTVAQTTDTLSETDTIYVYITSTGRFTVVFSSRLLSRLFLPTIAFLEIPLNTYANVYRTRSASC